VAAILPVLPALIGLATTVVGIASAKSPKLPEQRRLDVNDIDQELIDAQKRKGRQTFAGNNLLVGGQIGAERTTGTLIGST